MNGPMCTLQSYVNDYTLKKQRSTCSYWTAKTYFSFSNTKFVYFSLNGIYSPPIEDRRLLTESNKLSTNQDNNEEKELILAPFLIH